jgi:hypothetical protein
MKSEGNTFSRGQAICTLRCLNCIDTRGIPAKLRQIDFIFDLLIRGQRRARVRNLLKITTTGSRPSFVRLSGEPALRRRMFLIARRAIWSNSMTNATRAIMKRIKARQPNGLSSSCKSMMKLVRSTFECKRAEVASRFMLPAGNAQGSRALYCQRRRDVT